MLKTKADYENYLNGLYSEMDVEQVVYSLIYLTSNRRSKKTTVANIRKQHSENKVGSLVKRLDPIAFNVGFNEWNDEITSVSPNSTNAVLPAVRSFEHWTKKELEALPERKWDEEIGEFDSLIILPTNHLHDSGFWCMDFIAVRGKEPFCKLSGCSDVLHIDGIGGYGEWTADRGLPTLVPPKGWSIDCLKKSKLIRLFSNGKLRAGRAWSSFELYAVKRRNKMEKVNSGWTEFSVIRFFDPYGDGKSERKQLSRKNFHSEKTLKEVERIIEDYNSSRKYYIQAKIAKFDRRIKEISDFEKSEYCKEKEQ